LLLVFLVSLFSFSFSQSMTKINCYAPSYIGEKVEIYGFEDYFSRKEKLIGTTEVKADSNFTISFFNSKIQKIIVKSKNNKGFLYIQPNANYEIFMPSRNKYDEFRPLGNDVEIGFYDLPATDINYKILSFDKWVNNFLGTYFHTKNLKQEEFQNKLDTFRLNVSKAYIDDSSLFFQTYVRFSMAELDDIQIKGSYNRFQKYDFYLRNYPIVYESELYMSYVDNFYKNVSAHLTLETNNRIYLGVLKSSPTVVANAMSEEYTLKNAKLLELVMIKTLSDSYFKSDFPQTNIISILDSLSKHSLFKENGVIAGNLIEKLKEILPGSKAPSFSLKAFKSDSIVELANFRKKHLYIQFVDLNIKECEQEIELLKALHNKYKNDVEVITVFIKQDKYTKKQITMLETLPWQKFEIQANHDILKDYKILTYPSYVLLDSYGYVVASPALKPTPNGKYETIDKSFFFIQKLNEEEKK
jgi:hypothetical protein